MLESIVVDDRLGKPLFVPQTELSNAQLQFKLARDVDNKISKRQLVYYLVKGINRELFTSWRVSSRRRARRGDDDELSGVEHVNPTEGPYA